MAFNLLIISPLPCILFHYLNTLIITIIHTQQFPGISQERFFPRQSLPENINHIQPQQAKNKNFIAVPSGSQYNTPTSAHESQYNLQGSEKQLCQGDNYYIQVSR